MFYTVLTHGCDLTVAMATVTKQQGQRFVRFFGSLGVGFSLVTVYVGMNYVPIDVPDLSNVSDRMVFACRWLVLSLLPLLCCVFIVASTRFANIQTAGINPSLPRSEQIVGMKQRVLQNTLEQTVLHVAAVLALSTYLEGTSLKLVPISVFLFLCGRVTFYVGYLATDYTLYRAFGFSTTFFNNIMVIGYCLYCLFTGGASVGFL
ncbi:transmembrane protein 79-like [Patiria miniata]|uniref:MAPEG family protein n=1 Tax=Patiria miniata TaxID=46514 RepID=A0A914AEB7_PATMI|nr:transmembrane protein 79-like [Patiria miniata]